MERSKMLSVKTVDEYLTQLPGKERIALETLRKTIRSAAPKADEVISYQVPMYKQNGPLVCFAAYRDHCSFFVVNKDILKIFAGELQSYKTSGTTIHFTPDKPLPSALIQKIVKLRIKRNEENKITGAKKKSQTEKAKAGR